MKVLVLGLGSIGWRHARNFRGLGVDQVIGFDPDAERRQKFAAEFDGSVVASEDEGFAQKPGLVVVASPNRFHLAQANAAAQHDLPLFVEKPLGTDLEEARRFATLAKSKQLYVHSGSNWKFHPAFKTMKSWIGEGRIGRMTSMQVIAGQWLPDWHPWEDFRKGYSARADLGGGAVFDTHELDYILWLGGESAQFAGMISRSGALPIETEDNAACLMQLANGALVTLQTDYIQRQGLRRYVIAGDLGTIEWNSRDWKARLYTPGGTDDREIDTKLTDINEMYVAQSRRILSDLASGHSPETPLEHVLRVLELQIAWRRGL